MTAFLGSDQGAALVVCSLAAARRAGVADRAVFIWSGAEATDVRFPTARPDPGRSPAIAAAGRALFDAASTAAGRAAGVGIDDIDVLDIYSCFPSAVELATDALGHRPPTTRAGLTVTGGLPYFGGPGNNYTTHGIATVTDLLRDPAGRAPGSPWRGSSGWAWPPGSGGSSPSTPSGIYCQRPAAGGLPPGRHLGRPGRHRRLGRRGGPRRSTAPTPATVVAATVIRDDDGHADRRAASSPACPTVGTWPWPRPTTRSSRRWGSWTCPVWSGRPIVVEPGAAALPSGHRLTPQGRPAMSELLRERQGHIEILTINRPEARNAINGAVSRAFAAAFDELEADDDCWVVIVTGAGDKAFSAGMDLKAFTAGEAGDIMGAKGGFGGIAQRDFPKPIIAAVNGSALAGGCEIMLSCDLVVAVEEAKFGIPEVKRGLMAGGRRPHPAAQADPPGHRPRAGPHR